MARLLILLGEPGAVEGANFQVLSLSTSHSLCFTIRFDDETSTEGKLSATLNKKISQPVHSPFHYRLQERDKFKMKQVLELFMKIIVNKYKPTPLSPTPLRKKRPSLVRILSHLIKVVLYEAKL